MNGISELHAKPWSTNRYRGLHCSQGRSSCCSSADPAWTPTYSYHQGFQWWRPITAIGPSSCSRPSVTPLHPGHDEWPRCWQWLCQNGRKRPSCTRIWTSESCHMIAIVNKFHAIVVIHYHQWLIPKDYSGMDCWQHGDGVAILPLQGQRPRLAAIAGLLLTVRSLGMNFLFIWAVSTTFVFLACIL